MPPFVSRVLASPAVRRAFFALVLAVLAALGFSLQGCAGGQLEPKAQRAVDTFECYVEVLKPYVGAVCETADFVREVVEGRADLGRALTLLGHAQDVPRVVEALHECLPAPQALPSSLEGA